MQSQQASVLPSVEPSKELSTEIKVPQSLPKIKQEKAKEAGGMPIVIIFHITIQYQGIQFMESL